MMVNCPVCGKLTAIHWPQHWIYRRGDAYYCSWSCLDTDITKDLKLMHEVQRKRRERKMYNKLKKDGTPAKKSGPKPKKVEVPEPVSGGPWEKMETPETVEFVDGGLLPKVSAISYKTRCIETESGLFFYDKKHDVMTWTTEEGDEVTLDPTHWRLLAKNMTEILSIVGAVK